MERVMNECLDELQRINTKLTYDCMLLTDRVAKLEAELYPDIDIEATLLIHKEIETAISAGEFCRGGKWQLER
jgi:hypothetical protein